MKRMEIRIVIPDVLKGQLVDDWENITKNQQVPYMFRHKMVYCLTFTDPFHGYVSLLHFHENQT
jgi:hypothetical protein